MEKWAKDYEIKSCYEASSNGYVFYRYMRDLGYHCDVIAPSTIARKSGERKQNDPRDAKDLAKQYRSGDLSVVRTPNQEEESDRSLVRCRHFMKREEKRVKQAIDKFLQQRGYNYSKQNWTIEHSKWLKTLTMEDMDSYVLQVYLSELDNLEQMRIELDGKIEELSQTEKYRSAVSRLKAFRGIEILTAMTLITEVVDFKRFDSAGKLMSFFGLILGEETSDTSSKRLSITKAGNNQCRRILVEAAQNTRYKPLMSARLKKRHQGLDMETKAIARKAMKRLHHKYWKVQIKKGSQKAKVAVAREMTGFIWASMQKAA